MQIVKFKREQEQHRAHIDRIRNITPVLDTSTPESLGLKHLAFRPKKQQLIEDQRQKVAKENAKLMSGMTKIMNEKRARGKYVRPVSLNEIERKKEVDRVNFENQLMLERLGRIHPTISVSKLEKDFKKHLHAEANLRRRQMKPMGLPKDMHHSRAQENTSTFDASTYSYQHENYSGNASGIDMGLESPIKSMKEFRQHVISTKKLNKTSSMAAESDFSGSPLNPSRKPLSAADSGMGARTQQQYEAMGKNDALFEISHDPDA